MSPLFPTTRPPRRGSPVRLTRDVSGRRKGELGRFLAHSTNDRAWIEIGGSRIRVPVDALEILGMPRARPPPRTAPASSPGLEPLSRLFLRFAKSRLGSTPRSRLSSRLVFHAEQPTPIHYLSPRMPTCTRLKSCRCSAQPLLFACLCIPHDPPGWRRSTTSQPEGLNHD